jgi:antitoxin component of RelBE/YafQ-DinJ toxin-antitoxin module
MRRLSERLEVRITPSDRAQLQTVSGELGLTPSKFMRMTLRERVALEAALKRQGEPDER